MTRKSIFFIAVGVVLLYFSIILFMLSPLHGGKGTYYASNYMNHLSIRQVPAVNWCKELQWRSPHTPNVTALVSFPGSGNTWLRYLLQQATGVLTGSIYMDYGLRVHGFPGENVTDGSVLVVKTHEAPPLDLKRFKAAVLLIRNPRDAILADFNRLHKGHIGSAPKSAFERKLHDHKSKSAEWSTLTADWSRYVSTQLLVWETLHRLWLTRFPGPVHVLFYELLVRDTRRSLHGVLGFLGYNVTEADMKCALDNKEGIYRRKKKLRDFDPFTYEMYQALAEVKNNILKIVAEYRNKYEDDSERNRSNKDGYYENE